MADLGEQLLRWRGRRVGLMGLGNVELGDDGLGVRLAEAVAASLRHQGEAPSGGSAGEGTAGEGTIGGDAAGWRAQAEESTRGGAAAVRVFVAGTAPERLLRTVVERRFDEVVLLDAVQFGAAPGAAILLAPGELAARFPQVSTHRLSLGLLARWLELEGVAAVWLLGVQPGSLRPGAALTPEVEEAVGALAALLGAAAGAERARP